MRVPVLALLLTCAAGLPIRAASLHGDVNFLLGQKQLEDDALAPREEGGLLGAVMSFAGEDWPVHVAVDVVGYEDEEDDLSLRVLEVAVGVRKIWAAGAVRPYLGAGMERVAAAFEDDDDFFFFDNEGDGSGIGYWADAGLFWRLGEHFNLGFDLRWNRAEIDIDPDGAGALDDVQVGGLGGGLTLGFGW